MQLMECARTVTSDTTDFAAGRMVNYHSDFSDFEDLLVILEGAYREMDAVFCTNGLNSMEVTYKDTQVREGDDGIYLDVFSNKVLPFDMETTAEAVWDHFKGADKHRGKVYEKAAKVRWSKRPFLSAWFSCRLSIFGFDVDVGFGRVRHHRREFRERNVRRLDARHVPCEASFAPLRGGRPCGGGVHLDQDPFGSGGRAFCRPDAPPPVLRRGQAFVGA
jgi:hypothetical protein